MEIAILVTTAFGIGEKLINELLKRGESVYTLFPSPKDVPMSYLGKINLKYGFVKLDQETNIEKALPKKTINVFHIYEVYQAPFTKMFMANTAATMFLLEWAKRVGVAKFIYLSTGEIYGYGRNLNENAPYNPKSFYATTKFQAEMLSRYYNKNFELKIMRPFFPLGKELKYGYIHNLSEAVKNEVAIETEYCIITPTFIDDIVETLIRMRDQPGSSIFNICGSSTSVENLISGLAKMCKKPARVAKIGKAELCGDCSKAKTALGYKETPLETAIHNYITG